VDRIKRFILSHFEQLLVVAIVVGILGVNLVGISKLAVINLYYVPVLVAGYVLGKRMAVCTAIFSVLAVFFLAVLRPQTFAFTGPDVRFLGLSFHIWPNLMGWAGFLLLSSVVVGVLYEQKEARIRDLREAYIGVLEILSKYLESADRYTKGHSLRVADLSVDVAREMGLTLDEVENIRAASLLHDVGKIEISADLLRKAANLTDEEKAVMDSHAERGANILRSVGGVLREAVPIVLAHHHHYVEPAPAGADEADIPIGARIIAVADAFDAMTSDRPYRAGMPPWQALQEIERFAGSQFDPRVVAAFKRAIFPKIEVI
jgi:putative nucleotidyltransferase with HDIG domain